MRDKGSHLAAQIIGTGKDRLPIDAKTEQAIRDRCRTFIREDVDIPLAAALTALGFFVPLDMMGGAEELLGKTKPVSNS